MEMAKKVEGVKPEWLLGLAFTTSEAKKVEKDGRKSTTFIPVERPLKEGDLVDWKDKGDSVVLVAGDGKKYTVKKSGSAFSEKSGDKSNKF
jgi:hypothetical protein